MNVSVIFTNGCFDVITVAHIRLIDFAANVGKYVIIGLNSDQSVKTLKGSGRPINKEQDRKEVLLALKNVYQVFIFDEPNCAGLLQKIRPGIWVKGGDYNYESLNPLELSVAERVGCKIKFFPVVSGYSTSSTIAKIKGI